MIVEKSNQKMKSLAKIIEFAPAIAFFVSYKLTSDLILATAVIVASCVLAILLQYLLTREISRMQVFVTVAVVLFGLPTVLLNDPQIIKWKVTCVNVILALAIGICQYILKKNPFAYLFGRELPLPDFIWLKLGLWWMIFFILAGLLNVVIAFYLPALFSIDPVKAEDLWVDYKTFGNAILNFVFAIGSIGYLMKKYPDALAALKKDQ